MQLASNVRKISRVLRAPIVFHSERFFVYDVEQVQQSQISSSPWYQNQKNFNTGVADDSGITTGIRFPVIWNDQNRVIGRACYSSEARTVDELPSEACKPTH